MSSLEDVFISSAGVPNKRPIICKATCSTSSSNNSYQDYSDSGSDNVEMNGDDNDLYDSKEPLLLVPANDRLSKTLCALKGIKIDLKNAILVRSKYDDKNNKEKYLQYPQDKFKCLIAILMLVLAAFCNDLTLSYVHEKVPHTEPLPDIIFDNTKYNGNYLKYSEYLMLFLFIVMWCVILSHQHRFIIIRRVGTIGSLLYFGRCITMFVTQLPVADPNYKCSPKFSVEDRTYVNIILRALSIFSGAGLTINNKLSLCGDYIYSGHTIVFVITCLFITEYSPKRWRSLHLLTMLIAIIGIGLLLISRGHYSIDVVISYWITTRIFWEYHTLAANPNLRKNTSRHNHMRKFLWFPLCCYMEESMQKPIPNKYFFD
uniref:PAP2_C domain-containing protein n=1 Tax=Parastrongyloides trichosuri TaxID=131310 RepID=A0A0N4Z375_PARTI